MKKYLLAVLLLLSPALASAQNSNWYVPPWLQSSNTSGTTLSGPLLLPDGSTAAPAVGPASNTTAGFYFPAAGEVYWTYNTLPRWGWRGAGIWLRADAAFAWSASTLNLTAADTFLYRDAANTLALRNSTNAQTFNIYNTYTDGSNYERGNLDWNGNIFEVGVEYAGSGSNRAVALKSNNTALLYWNGASFYPSSSDAFEFGRNTNFVTNFYLSRAIQGSKTKALTEASATAVTQIAVPQTAGSNFADATIEWAVYASDGTDSQVRKGSTYLAAVNKAGTETCTVGDIGTTQVAVSAGTLTCTTSCITGLTDVVQFALNCTSSLTQTTLNALARLDMMQPNTVTPQ